MDNVVLIIPLVAQVTARIMASVLKENRWERLLLCLLEVRASGLISSCFDIVCLYRKLNHKKIICE